MSTRRTCERSARDGAVSGAGLVRLSQCDLWQRQNAFYRKHGIRSWSADVPYYATSNPAIADAYAQVLFRFMKDWTARSAHVSREPFHVLELGAGHGLFGFYLVRRLAELTREPGSGDVRFVHVMTDACEEIVEHWRQQPELSALAEAGLLDFAVFDVEKDEDITLLGSGRRLGTGNPLMVVANYIFDTISHDVFRLLDGRLQEGLIEVAPRVPEIEANTRIALDRLGSGLRFRDAELPVYGDNDLDTVLAGYRRELADGYLLVPVGAVACVRRLLGMSGDRLLLLATDKGFSRHLPAFAAEMPSVSFHGSMSMMVNFDCIGRYFECRGGQAVHQEPQQSVATSLFLAGLDLEALPETRRAVASHLGPLSPGNFFALYQHFAATAPACTLETVIAYLGVSHWDPQVLQMFLGRILACLPAAGAMTVRDLGDALHRVAKHSFPLPGAPDTLADVGAVFLESGDLRTALHYFQRSARRLGDRTPTRYNLGLCHFGLGETEKARKQFAAVVEREPDHVLARGWISQIDAESATVGATPNPGRLHRSPESNS